MACQFVTEFKGKIELCNIANWTYLVSFLSGSYPKTTVLA